MHPLKPQIKLTASTLDGFPSFEQQRLRKAQYLCALNKGYKNYKYSSFFYTPSVHSVELQTVNVYYAQVVCTVKIRALQV